MAAIDAEVAWNAVLNRDRRFDGLFVYAVSSTLVYCRPSCPSRRPTRARATFFPSPRQAEAAGFRACRRCDPRSPDGNRTEHLVDRARRYLDRQSDKPVTLRRLAAFVGISPFHLQRTFTRAVGLSPKAYQDARRMERFTISLKQGKTVTDAIYEAGFGSSSRVYERANGAFGMTPSVFRSGGKGVTLRYASAPTAVGRMLVAATERGIAAVHLGESEASLVALLKDEYPHAVLRCDPQGLTRQLHDMIRCLQGQIDGDRLPLDVSATGFQRKVWAALQRIPRGSTRSYREIAKVIGRPEAVRAVARACATNPLAVAVPCHRVVREDGRPSGYRWGLLRKQRLLDFERFCPAETDPAG